MLKNNINMSSLVTVSYARTSGEINGEHSIPNQQELMRKYAAKHHLTIHLELADNQLTGENTNRPAYQQLLALVKQERVDIILVPYFDRLSRESQHLSSLLFDLRANRVECISCIDGRKLSQMSDFEPLMIAMRVYGTGPLTHRQK
jgi:DNA invertase Pin-like site-specific DNA recombinase